MTVGQLIKRLNRYHPKAIVHVTSDVMWATKVRVTYGFDDDNKYQPKGVATAATAPAVIIIGAA